MIDFETKEGHRAMVLDDKGEAGFIPAVNPFGFGCGCCGAYHSVKYERDGDDLVLTYRLDDEETQRLRSHLGADSLPEKYVRAQQLLANWQATGQAVQAVLLEVAEIMGSAIKSVQLGDFSGAILACKAAEDLVTPFVPEAKREERRVILC